jgi:hypothetical protein
MCQSIVDVIIACHRMDLRLSRQPSEWLRENNPIVILFERSAIILLLIACWAIRGIFSINPR